MSEYILPGYYNLVSATLITFNTGREIDILHLIPRFEISESIERDSIRGTASIIDNIGLMDDLPIRGEERLILRIKDALGTDRTYDLSIYKVTDISINKTNDGMSYTLHFASTARFLAGRHCLVEAHDKPISEIAKYVFSKYYSDTKKELIIEETIGIFRCVIPHYTPMQTMHFLAQRAFSSSSPSCSFRFFESSENFFFVSDEFLIEYFKENPDEIKEFIYDESLGKGPEELIPQMQNLKSVQNPERVNTIADLDSGSYRSNVLEIDLTRKVVSDRKYNYQTEKSKYNTTGSGADSHTPDFTDFYFTENNQRSYLVYKDYASIGDLPGQLRTEQYLPEITSNRVAYVHHLNKTKVYATANGRLDLKAGDIISLVIPEFVSSSDKGLNTKISGNYMLAECTHSFKEDLYETHIKLIKYNLES